MPPSCVSVSGYQPFNSCTPAPQVTQICRPAAPQLPNANVPGTADPPPTSCASVPGHQRTSVTPAHLPHSCVSDPAYQRPQVTHIRHPPPSCDSVPEYQRPGYALRRFAAFCDVLVSGLPPGRRLYDLKRTLSQRLPEKPLKIYPINQGPPLGQFWAGSGTTNEEREEQHDMPQPPATASSDWDHGLFAEVQSIGDL